MASQAKETCEKVLRSIKQSQLDFLLQETPYSVFLTIRKRFIKDFKNLSTATQTIESDFVIKDLKSDNKELRDVIIGKEEEIETSKNETFILQKRLKMLKGSY